MLALLLGKPLHGQTRRIDHAPEVLRLEANVAEEARVGWTGSGAGFTPRRADLVEYVRVHSAGLPDGVLVYRARGYEPQAEDEELVRETLWPP